MSDSLIGRLSRTIRGAVSDTAASDLEPSELLAQACPGWVLAWVRLPDGGVRVEATNNSPNPLDGELLNTAVTIPPDVYRDALSTRANFIGVMRQAVEELVDKITTDRTAVWAMLCREAVAGGRRAGKSDAQFNQNLQFFIGQQWVTREVVEDGRRGLLDEDDPSPVVRLDGISGVSIPSVELLPRPARAYFDD